MSCLTNELNEMKAKSIDEIYILNCFDGANSLIIKISMRSVLMVI